MNMQRGLCKPKLAPDLAVMRVRTAGSRQLGAVIRQNGAFDFAIRAYRFGGGPAPPECVEVR